MRILKISFFFSVGTMLRLNYISCHQRTGEGSVKVEGVKIIYFPQKGRVCVTLEV